MSEQTVGALKDILQKGIAQSIFSAAQLVVSDSNGICVDIAVGQTKSRLEKNGIYVPQTITHESLFDIASLTKPLATAGLVMKAVEAGALSLDQKLVTLDCVKLPSWLLASTIADLLSHRTPLQAWINFYDSMPSIEDHRGARLCIERMIEESSPRKDASAYCYSDLGYLLLGFILESLYGDSLEHLFTEMLAIPLGLQSQMMYCPLHHVEQKRIVATCWRHGCTVQGHPDDANACALTHYAGHAGLFASALAVDAYVRAILNGSFPCDSKIVDAFLSYHHPETPYALGWDRPTSKDSLSARNVGDPVLGHLGFTGCSVWFDTTSKRCVTLLTNRTHTNDDPKSINPLRREVYSLAWNKG